MFLQDLSNNGMEDLDQIDQNNLEKRWNFLQRVREGLKARFYKEYLGVLRCSRTKRTDSLEIGDIVLVGSDNKRRLDWPLAKVIDLFPGRDGITRLAKIKTQNGEMLRPLQRLYPLEIRDGILDQPSDVESPADVGEQHQPADPELEDSPGLQEDVQPVQTRTGRIVKPRDILDL